MFFQLLDICGESSQLCRGGVAGHFDMICGSAKAEVKLCGKQQNKWDLARKQQFFGKRLVVATNRKVDQAVLNVDRRGQHGPGLQDLEDVQVPAAHGRWKGERYVLP